ncbi:PREDICTED: uncharacterized protein LOC105124090 [Populus euphratica]|uniref:Uncharacterized protein LOC105124090 n=1 Tax=Populus euphratica TaxID=75702 RepID=A0AAJ6U340_POPEU|nr:PREDICTED: uncharacterized protein LOC105124090 [Populus euphratica]
MGCAVSKQEEEDNVVSLCRERKRLLKFAVERRYAFADAQCKYNQSLYGVAMALRLFVARHSSPNSPFLITFPSTSSTNDPKETLICNSNFHQQRPTEATHATISCQDSVSKVSLVSPKLETKKQEVQECSDSEDFEEEGDSEDGGGVCSHFYGNEDGEAVCDHFYDEASPLMPSSERGFGWDFFNPFDEVRTEVVNGFRQSSDEDFRAVREKEGIPELEEVNERVQSENEQVDMKIGDVGCKESGVSDVKSGDSANVELGESKGLRVIDTPTKGRELLEALKDIEDHFIKAYDSGLEISRMLEANRVQFLSGLDEIKESSNKLARSITWSRSLSSRSSSSKSLLSSSSVSSSMWTELKSDLFDDYGMDAGSHSLTLGRLYAWEKKLYEEVKAGEQTRKLYVRKCSRLRNQDTSEGGLHLIDKSCAEANDLHSRISVALRSVESISDRIQKLRDEELEPQLVELLHGLMRNWKMMLESHETQNRVMLEVKYFNSPAYGKFSNDSHRLATLQLEAELDNWHSSFTAYVSTQKAYIEALGGWLSQFVSPKVEFCSSGNSLARPYRINWPPLVVTCHDWLACLDKLPRKTVACAMKSFGKDIHALWNQQGEEQQQKRKVDGLAKELDRRTLAFQRAERRILESKISEQESKLTARNCIEYIAERKNQLEMFRKRLDEEQGKHLASMQETHGITINGFQRGFSSVFESLAEFSKATVKMYSDLVTYMKNAKTEENNDSNISYMEEMGSQAPSCKA